MNKHMRDVLMADVLTKAMTMGSYLDPRVWGNGGTIASNPPKRGLSKKARHKIKMIKNSRRKNRRK